MNTKISKEIDFSLNERIDLFMSEVGLKPASLVKSGVSTQQYLSNVRKKKRTPNVDFCTRLLIAYPNLRWQWLLAGEGEMLIKKNYAAFEPDLDTVNEGFDCTNLVCAKKIAWLHEQLLEAANKIIELQAKLISMNKKETDDANSTQLADDTKGSIAS